MSIGAIFNTILYYPLLNILIIFYMYVGHDLGIAVILLTLLIKIILFPVSIKAVRSQKALNSIQPKMKEIQEKYKDDKTKQSQMMMQLYKTEKVSPLSGCLPLLLQLPILIALYQVFLKGLNIDVLRTSLYGFVPQPEAINTIFLGIIDLAQPNIILALIAGILQFVQSKISLPKTKEKGMASMMQSQMTYIFPIITVFIVWRLGAIIGLYWLTSILFSIGEHYLIKRRGQKADKENN